MEIIHAVIVALVFGAAVYVMRAVLVSRKHKNSADTSVTTNPAYDYSADDFMCLMRTDGSTTICFRGGGGFTAHPRKSVPPNSS